MAGFRAAAREAFSYRAAEGTDNRHCGLRRYCADFGALDLVTAGGCMWRLDNDVERWGALTLLAWSVWLAAAFGRIFDPGARAVVDGIDRSLRGAASILF